MWAVCCQSAQGSQNERYNLGGAGVGLQPFSLSNIHDRDLFSSSVITSEASKIISNQHNTAAVLMSDVHNPEHGERRQEHIACE